jgi:hypothetical protein
VACTLADTSLVAVVTQTLPWQFPSLLSSLTAAAAAAALMLAGADLAAAAQQMLP